MKALEKEKKIQQINWDELFQQYRLDLISKLKSKTLDYFENLKLVELEKGQLVPYDYFAQFQKDGDCYVFHLYCDYFGHLKKLSFEKNKVVLVEIMGTKHLETNYLLEEEKEKLRPFLEQIGEWVKKGVYDIKEAIFEDSFVYFKSNFKGKEIQEIIKDEKGNISIIVNNEKMPIKIILKDN
jgi:hypothetical protein